MRIKFIFFLLSLIITGVQGQQFNCSNFKVGSYVNMEDGEVKSKIIRNKKFQLEENGAVKIKLKIKWIDDCTYELTFVEGNDAWWSMVGNNYNAEKLIVRITATDENSYVQESHKVGSDFIYRSVMVKVQ